MKRRFLVAACCVLLSAGSMRAQPRGQGADPISGSWGTDGVSFLELQFDGRRAVSGTTIWREGGKERSRGAIETGTFDPKTGVLRLEGSAKGRDGAVEKYVIEGKLEKGTLAGTFAFGSNHGVFAFTRK